MTLSLSVIGLAATGLRPAPAIAAGTQTPPAQPSNRAGSQPSPGPTCDLLYARGCARLRAGDVRAAIELLRRAATQCPHAADYALKLGEAHAAAGEIGTALRLLGKLTAEHPDHAACRLALARVQALNEDWPAVEATLAPLETRLDPEHLAILARACVRNRRARHAELILRRHLKRTPDSATLWLALIDQYLARDQSELALQCTREAERHLGVSPQLQLRRARAYYHLGQVLGQTQVLRMPNHREGQFVGEWLLVEKRAEPDRFLCCPSASALYAVRQALDAGLDEPSAHCLHARIWQRLGRPDVGLAILKSREPILLEQASPETLETLSDLALAADALDDFLRYVRRRTQHDGRNRTELFFNAYLAVAERYNQRGDEAMHREFLQRALMLRAEDADLMLQLADALWDTGARAEAALWYRRVLERQPAHPDRPRILLRLGD